jgi:hypothetical protein
MTAGDFAARSMLPDRRRPVEVVHAAPVGGLSFAACCDRTLLELPRYERVSHNPDEVNCGRLSRVDEGILAGGPFVAEHQNSEQLLYEMAMGVRMLCGPTVTLPQAYQHVRTAVEELAGGRDPAEFWSTALMVQITVRASELAVSD